MWDYTEKVKDHFFNPRNVGKVEDYDGIGTVGSIACGDALTLTFKLDERKERITDVKFQTFGCASAIASSSALTELIKGKTIEEAKKVTNQDIADFLGGLPDQKMHCSVMGKEALEAAIENFKTGKIADREIHGDLVCSCFGVTKEQIENVIKENGLTTIEEVTNFTKAGGGCGGCQPDILEILDRLAEEREKAGAATEKKKKKLTNIQRMQLIQETIGREIRPQLKADGGDIELIDVEGPKVTVALRGACSGCNVAQFTLRDVVEAKLREFVADDIVVEEEK